MTGKLFREATKQSALSQAWNKVHANGIASKSQTTKNEVEAFAQGASTKIRRIQRGLRSGSFKFAASEGKKIPKDNGDFRPIVLAPIETRIIQRAVLDKLLTVAPLKSFIETPYSFGGIRKLDDDGLAAVPAAIQAVLNAKSIGLKFVRCADISSFFTRIKKPDARRIIADAVLDLDFLALFDSCTKVELSNLEKLGVDAQRFPREDLGVAQGSALSPLLGNILLHDFDSQMNNGDCRCYRYIDDIIILAPDEKACNARFRLAEKLLTAHEMKFSPAKSSGGVKTFETGFSFLGIEIKNGLIRPDGDALGRFKQKISGVVADSIKAFLDYDNSKAFPYEKALVPTFQRLSGTIRGWGKHYRFCNDMKSFSDLDLFADEEIRKLISIYSSTRKKTETRSREFLGITRLTDIDWKPFQWPTQLKKLDA